MTIPSPTSRLAKGYANQKTDGAHMVDLIDSATGHIIARCVFEQYADEILAALRNAERERCAKIASDQQYGEPCGPQEVAYNDACSRIHDAILNQSE
jgi:hypothetical protein